jgi:hypothetical protein
MAIQEKVTAKVGEGLKSGARKIAQEGFKKIEEKTKGIIKTYGWGYILQNIPGLDILGAFTFPKLRLVFRQGKQAQTGLLAPDLMLMAAVGLFLDIIVLIVAIVELCVGDVDLTLISTIIAWGSTILFGLWMWLRNGAITGYHPQQLQEQEDQAEESDQQEEEEEGGGGDEKKKKKEEKKEKQGGQPQTKEEKLQGFDKANAGGKAPTGTIKAPSAGSKGFGGKKR